MKTLKADVQSPDWHGTAQAADVDKGDLERLLRSEGLMDREIESLVAIELYVGEDYGGRMRVPHVRALMAEGRDHDQVAKATEKSGDAIPLRAVDAHVTMEEFVGLFKHFKVVLTRSDLELDGRPYEERS